jgi:hypothetical protein
MAPTPTPSSSIEPKGVWQLVDGFPPAGTSLSTIAVVGGDRLVIGGSSEAANATCPSQREARLWTSIDGLSWNDESMQSASDGTVDVLPAGGSLAIGSSGSPGCLGSGPAAWSSADSSDWRRLTTSGLEPGNEIVDMVTTGDSMDFVASGRFASDSEAMGIWRMRLDEAGSQWQHAAGPPPSIRDSTLTSLASDGRAVVGFDVTRNPHVWYSLDAGDSWTSADYRSSFGLLTTDSAVGQTGFAASGSACCGLPDERYGVVIRSVDGKAWADARPGLAFGKPIEAVLATERGWIALGEETYLSADGSDWRLGPPLPGYESKVYMLNRVPVPYRLAVAAVGNRVVAITPDRAWVASLDDLTAGKWPAAATAAEMPVLGGRYETTLLTHCGPFNGPLYFGMRSWVPDLPEGYFPLSFDGFYEHGTLGFVAADRLEFTGSKGDVVVYQPSDDPPHAFPCH